MSEVEQEALKLDDEALLTALEAIAKVAGLDREDVDEDVARAAILAYLRSSKSTGEPVADDGFDSGDFSRLHDTLFSAAGVRGRGHALRASMSNNFNISLAALKRATSTLSPPERDGWVLVPREPTEAQWGGLARAIVMWWGIGSAPTGALLYKHLKLTGEIAPAWLLAEIPDIDHVPPKGTVAACIYRAMIEALSASPSIPPASADASSPPAVQSGMGGVWTATCVAEDTTGDKSYQVRQPPCPCCDNVKVTLVYADNEASAITIAQAHSPRSSPPAPGGRETDK